MSDGATIDRLEIEIEATSTTAETRIGNIIKMLEGMRDSASRAVSPFKSLREALNIGKKQSGMQAINKAMEQTKGQAASLRKTLSLASSGLDAVKFSKELAKIDAEISKTDKQAQSLRDSLSYLTMPVSGASATGKLGVADEVAEAEAKLKELEKVRSMLTDQRAALWSNMEQQDSGGTNQQAADALTKGLKNADIQALKTSRSLSEMQNRLAVLERMKGFIKSSEYQTAAGQVRGYANAVDTATERVNALKSALADAQAGKPGMSTEGVSQLINDYQAAKSEVQYLGTAASYALKDAERAAKNASGEASRLSEVFAGVKNSALSGLKGIGSYIASNFTRPFKSAISTFDKWKSAIGRLALYRVIRSAIKLVTEGLKEGTENLYYFSQLAGSQFAATKDRLATSSQYLKNSLGAMASPLIQAIAPAVDMLIDKFVDLLNIVNAAFAALTGKTSFTKALKSGAQYGDELSGALGSAAGSAKDIKRYLIGIDELNIIPDTNTGSGGGGAGGLSKDYPSMFEDVEIPSTISDFAQSIKDAINNNDWRGVGSLLAEKLNGIIADVNAKDIGSKLGTKITNGLNAVYGFLSIFSFSGLAAKVAEGLNGALEALDFSTAGQVFARKLTIIPDLAIGFFSTLDFGLLAQGLSNFITGALDETTAWLSGYDWSELGATVWQKLKDTLTNIDYAGIASSLFTALGTAIRSAGGLIGGFIGGIGADIKQWWDEDIASQDWKETATNLLNAVGEGFKDVAAWVKENILDPFGEALFGGSTWESISESGALEGLGGLAVAMGIFSKLKNIEIAGDAAQKLEELSTATNGITTKLSSLAKELGLGLVVIGEAAAAALLVTGAVALLGMELEQVGIAWEPVIENAGTVAIGMGVGTALLGGVGTAAAMLGSVGKTLAVNVGIGTAILAEVGVATGLFIAEVWGIGKGLDEVGKAWQPVLDNGDTIKTGILTGTGLLTGIGIVTAALGAVTIGTAGALPLAIGIGTGVLAELSAATVLFTESLVAVADEMTDNLAPALSDFNEVLPGLTENMGGFKDYMSQFAGLVVAYSADTAVAGIAATIETIIGWFTKDPLEKLKSDVEKIYGQAAALNTQLDLAVPALETASASVGVYYEYLGGISSTVSTYAQDGSAVSMLGSVVETLIGYFDGNPLKSLSDSVNTNYKALTDKKGLNARLAAVVPELYTAYTSLSSYIGYLNLISDTTNGMTFTGIADSVFVDMTGIGSSLVSGFTQGIINAGGVGSPVISGLNDMLDNIGQYDWYSVGTSIGTGIVNGMYNIGQPLAAWGQAVLNEVQAMFDIHSPSRVFRDEVGYFLGTGIGAGIDDSRPEILSTISGLSDDMLEQVAAASASMTAEAAFPVNTNMRVQYERDAYAECGTDDLAGVVQSTGEDIISVIFGAAQQIITAINEKDNNTYMDGRMVSRGVTDMQERRAIMLGKSPSFA